MGAKLFFKGMNNAKDPRTLDVVVSRDSMGGECVSMLNVDPDSDGGFKTRKAATEILATATHSGWSEGLHCYCVSGGYLCSFNGVALTPIFSVDPNLPMAFCLVNDVVVASNGVDYLVIENGVTSFAAPSTDEFKTTPPAGKFLAFHNGCVWIGSDNTVYKTDPFTVDTCDTRHMTYPITQDTLTGLVAVDDGLFVGTTKETFFLSTGDSISLRKVADYGMISGTARPVMAEDLGMLKASGQAAVWASKKGFCVGSAGGSFVNVSEGVMNLPDVTTGASILREQNGLIHFLACLGDGAMFNVYQPPTLELDEAELFC